MVVGHSLRLLIENQTNAAKFERFEMNQSEESTETTVSQNTV